MNSGEEWINGLRHFNKQLSKLKKKKKKKTVEEYSNWNKNTPEGIKSTLDDTEEQIG